MGGAYKDDEATRVDASILRKHQDAPPIAVGELPSFAPPDEPSQHTARIDLNEVDRRALPFKRSGHKRRGDQQGASDARADRFELPDEEVTNEIPLLAETGAMRPVKEPAMPFEDSVDSDGPTRVRQDGGGPAVVRDAPKYPPPALTPLDQQPLSSSQWSAEAAPRLATVDPEELPSSLAPPPSMAAAPTPNNMVRNVVVGAVVVLAIAVAAAIMM